MKFCIEIEVDDMSPNEEFCGDKCKGLNNGICHLFNTKLEDYSDNKIIDIRDGTITYDKTRIIHKWKRCKQCIDMSYIFGNTKDKGN